MTKVALVFCYFGKFPNYFHLFLDSCRRNDSIDFIFFTDCEYSPFPDNVFFHNTSFEELKKRIANNFDFDIKLNTPYKLCDFKPAFGEIFSEELKGYDFWGHADVDMIFGNLRDFLTEDIFQSYNKIYQFGHLTLYRNTAENNALYKLPGGIDYREAFTTEEIKVFDEVAGVGKKFDINGIPSFKRRDYADITKVTDRFALTAVYLTKEEIKNNNYDEQIFYFDNGEICRDYYENNILKTDKFNYIHFSSRKMPVNFNTIPNSYYISKNGFTEKRGKTTIEIIKAYNKKDDKADKKAAKKRRIIDIKRRIKKVFIRIKERRPIL